MSQLGSTKSKHT